MLFKKEIKQILQKTRVNFNLSLPELLESAIKREEGMLTNKGSLRVTTGKYTGRSPHDKFF
ncbi:MAG TPA: phosphoenolpyruvate carboxykinase (ATP), partial [Clostridia bacterium]|nr:phosphoenolpyruvate carboxykinase (ATP) [Clostridia bacterium]